MKLMMLAVALLGGAGLVMPLRAQSTNAPIPELNLTDIAIFEAQTNVLVVKGFGTSGSVNIGEGLLSVRLKESYNPDTGSKLQAVVLDYAEGPVRQRAVVDRVEIDSLLRALDYVRSATYDVTGLPGFEASYRTRDGFRVIGLGSHRQSAVQTFVQFDGCGRILLNSDQMSQLRSEIAQAQRTLDELKPVK
jgi:hypothetical protein